MNNGMRPDRIYSSPMYRTIETANYVTEKFDLDILVEDGFMCLYFINKLYFIVFIV